VRVRDFSDVDRAFDELRANIRRTAEIADGHQLDAISLTTTTTRIPHKLGRKLRGYFLVGANANVTVFDEHASKLDTDKYLHLQASAAATVNIWVY